MVFTVLVAADVYGTKGNFEVTFPSQPTLSELTRQTESIYGVEAAARRPVGTLAAPFLVSRFQLYNERLQQWVDLTSPSQLTDRAQVFAFQSSMPINGASVASNASAAAADAAAANAAATTAAHAAAHNAAVAHSSAVATAAANTALATQQYQQQQAAAQAAAAASAAAARQQAAVIPTVPTTVVQMPAFSDTATHEDKTRAVFEGLDTNGNRVLEPEEIRQAFELLHIDFSGSTISDLIAKADLDRDGVVAYGEWQRFSERFPTLIDSFYFRLKAYWEDVRRQQEIRASKEMLAELKERSQQAQVDWLEAQRDSDAARSRLSAQEVSLVQAIDAQRAAEQALLEAHRDVERATADCLAREQELISQREREAQAGILHADAVRDTEAAQVRLQHAQAATAAALERERSANAVLTEAQAEVERQRQITAQRTAEVSDARSREQAAALAATEAVRDATLAGERLARADLDVAAKQQREKELEAAHTQSTLETQRGTARRDEEAHALQIQRQNEEAAHITRLEAQRVAEEADRKVVALEAENTAFNQRRRTVEEQEAPLLEQEIRLRSQRDALEEKEAKLRGDHRLFCEATRAQEEIASSPLALANAVSPQREYTLAAAAATAHQLHQVNATHVAHAAQAQAKAAQAAATTYAAHSAASSAAAAAHASNTVHAAAANAAAYTGYPAYHPAAAQAYPSAAASTLSAAATPRPESAFPTSRSYAAYSATSPYDTPLKPGRLA